MDDSETPDFTKDESDFNLLQTLIDAESRGSSLASRLREIYQTFDHDQAQINHRKVQEILSAMRDDLGETLSNYEEDEQDEAFEEFYANGWHDSLFDSEFNPLNISGETHQLIFDELQKSISDEGAFGNSEVLDGFVGWTNAMNEWGFLLSPFVPKNVLKSMIALDPTSNNYMSSIAVSPALSKRFLHHVADELISANGSRWIGLALLVNANSDLYVLDSLCRYGANDMANSYCYFPTSGGMSEWVTGVCGPLVGKSWFCYPDAFDSWSENDLVGPLHEDSPEVLKSLVSIASLYLGTSQGSKEQTRETLRSSDTFGNLLVCFRMIQEFKFGRAKLEDEIQSDSSLVRTVLFWMPGINPEKRAILQESGLALPEEVGKLLIKGWSENLNLIF